MKEEYQLSQREQRVMDLLWNAKEGMTSVDMLERLGDIMPNATYVHRTINSLLDAEFIRECGSVRYRTQYARKFEPCLTREEYAAKYLIRQGIRRKSFGRVAAALFDETQEDPKQNTDELIEQLEEIIENLKTQADAEK